MKRFVLLLELFCLTLLALTASARSEERKNYAEYVPTSEYEARDVCGWTVYVAADLRANPELDKKSIWIQEKDPTYTIPCYHVSREWLETHGVNPAKTNGVDIPNAQYFLSEYDRQPMMLLHELAHGYHFKTVENGYSNGVILYAYKNAMENKLYDRVLNYYQQEGKAYSATNPMEYFAELTECYFGENDFYPFVKTEFRRHDPVGYAMIEQIWGVK